MTEDDELVNAVAKKKVKFPSSSADSKPRSKPKRRKKEDTVRLLGAISRGEA